MYVAVAVASIQGKSRFRVAEDESRNSTVAGGGMLVFNENSGILPSLKILREWCPCLTNKKSISDIESYLCFCHIKVKPSTFTYFSSFLLMT